MNVGQYPHRHSQLTGGVREAFQPQLMGAVVLPRAQKRDPPVSQAVEVFRGHAAAQTVVHADCLDGGRLRRLLEGTQQHDGHPAAVAAD